MLPLLKLKEEYEHYIIKLLRVSELTVWITEKVKRQHEEALCLFIEPLPGSRLENSLHGSHMKIQKI